MRSLLLISLLVACAPSAAAQEPPPPPPAFCELPPPPGPEVFCARYPGAVEIQPELLGGLTLDSLQSLVRYPEAARSLQVEGRVFVQFVVTERGTVEDIGVARGLHPLLDAEALRVTRLARFRPGCQRGRPVRVRFTLPIVFRLERRP